MREERVPQPVALLKTNWKPQRDCSCRKFREQRKSPESFEEKLVVLDPSLRYRHVIEVVQQECTRELAHGIRADGVMGIEPPVEFIPNAIIAIQIASSTIPVELGAGKGGCGSGAWESLCPSSLIRAESRQARTAHES